MFELELDLLGSLSVTCSALAMTLSNDKELHGLRLSCGGELVDGTWRRPKPRPHPRPRMAGGHNLKSASVLASASRWSERACRCFYVPASCCPRRTSASGSSVLSAVDTRRTLRSFRCAATTAAASTRLYGMPHVHLITSFIRYLYNVM